MPRSIDAKSLCSYKYFRFLQLTYIFDTNRQAPGFIGLDEIFNLGIGDLAIVIFRAVGTFVPTAILDFRQFFAPVFLFCTHVPKARRT